MRIQIVGIQQQNYTLDNGYSFDGVKLHCIDLDTSTDGQLGNQVTQMRIERNSHLMNTPLKVGGKYICYFNQKKALDYIAPLEE